MSSLFKISFRTACITFAICDAALAESLNKDSFFDSKAMPIVLSASKLPQPITEAPATITIIDRALIKASGATEIVEVFRLVPGMQVGSARGNFPVVSYQGLTSAFPQGVQVVIDGSSVYSPIFGGALWNNLPITLEDIERIEIVRGPNNASFGANAFQGVINITTIHSDLAQGITGSYQRNDEQAERTFMRYGGANKDGKLSYRVSLATEKDEGYPDLFDDFSKDEISSRVDLRVNNQNSLQFSFAAMDSRRQTAYPDSTSAIAILDPKRNRDESSQFAQIAWDHEINHEQQLKTNFSFQHFDGEDKYVLGSLPIDLSTESTRWNLDFEHLLRLNLTQRLAWGAGAIYETVYAPYHLNTSKDQTNTRVRTFANLETRLTKKLFLNTGGLVEDDEISGTHFSPRIAFNYLVTPNHAYRFIATEAFRSPVTTEEHRNTVFASTPIITSVGDLEPETVTSFEAGYHGIYWLNALNVDVKLFHNDYDDLINNSLSSGTLVIDNVDEATTYGTEFELNYRPDRNNLFHAGYAYTTITNESNSRIKDSIPEHNFNLLYSHQYGKGWYSGIEYYYTSEMQYLGGQNDPQSRFQRMDLSLGKLINFANHQSVDISVDFQVALDDNVDFHESATADNLIYLKVEYRAK